MSKPTPLDTGKLTAEVDSRCPQTMVCLFHTDEGSAMWLTTEECLALRDWLNEFLNS